LIENKAQKEAEGIVKEINLSGIETSAPEKLQFSYSFNILENKEKIGSVQIYFGKKGIKRVLQGSLTHPYNQVVNEILNTYSDELFLSNEMKSIEPNEYIGSDETGKGDYFGPLVVSAVYVDPEMIIKLKKIGVQDSKNLADVKINSMAHEIKKIVAENYKIVKINPPKYNELFSKLQNINKILGWAHSKAIEELLKMTNAKTVIIDKFSSAGLMVEYNNKGINFIKETKAEKYTAVAAASILARNELNFWFDKHKREGLQLNKGASDIVDRIASQIRKKYGEDKLKEIAKIHFKNTIKSIHK